MAGSSVHCVPPVRKNLQGEPPHPHVAKMRGDATEFAVSGKKKLRIQKYPDTCGRGLSFLSTENILVNILRLLPTTILFSNVFGVWMALK